MSLRIFLHAVRLVFSQFGDAIRISGWIYLAANIMAFIWAFMAVGVGGQPPELPEPPAMSLQDVLISLAVAAIYLWIAVAWHRFVLLDERPAAALPAFLGDRLLAYLGRLIQVSLIYLVIGSTVAIGSLMLLANVAGDKPVAVALLPIVLITILLLLSYRLAPLFPAAAIGQPITIRAAWASTRGATWTLLLLAVISAIASVVIDLPTLLLAPLLYGIPAFVWLAVTAWLKLMVGISILTTIYGIYVEKRTIA